MKLFKKGSHTSKEASRSRALIAAGFFIATLLLIHSAVTIVRLVTQTNTLVGSSFRPVNITARYDFETFDAVFPGVRASLAPAEEEEAPVIEVASTSESVEEASNSIEAGE
ncbi:MAG: hypothetical protein R3B52_02285 [Candidatus Paceibacterota bacterium]